ncbi:tetratricopeptide repeat-containing sulfotransferase family protein [Singulisphaera sp. PoT]|uniref:tetratricopeptide repeat-containing sulfotransferase family protein n=1 Tax=Singulisphaera sp. PoT TaxID=3411797 RepID=UPI003BF5CA0D
MPIDLREALEFHRRGDLPQAARLYEQAIAENPQRHEALHLLGLVALQSRQLGKAMELLSRAASLAPSEASYHASLAEAHWNLGGLDKATECYQTALRLRPNDPELLCNYGATLVDRGELDAAIGCFQRALDSRPNFVVAHNNLGNALQIKGDQERAVAHFRQALEIDPSMAGVHSNLGRLLLERGAGDEALPHLFEAIRLLPEVAEFRINLGNALAFLDRTEEAASQMRTAVQLRPNMASAHAALGGIQEQLGDVELAIGSYGSAVRFDPRHTGALARLMSLSKDTFSERDVTHVESLLVDRSLPPDRRLTLEFAWAQWLEGEGDYERAADLATRANRLQSQLFQRRGKSYDGASYGRFVGQVLDGFSPEFFQRVRGFGLDTERPVFVVGLPRSGTSLIEQILASHPQIYGAGELRMAQESFESLPRFVGVTSTLRESLDRLDEDGIHGLALNHLAKLDTLGKGAERVVDKMPENALYLGFIATLFPRAKIIHCRRDLRDVALSCWMTNFSQVRWASDIEHIVSRFQEYRRLMDHWREVLPVPIIDLDYEALVEDLEGHSRKLVEWCGLDWDEACLNYHQTRRSVKTASAAQVRRPIYKSSVGRWKPFESLLSPLFDRL